MFPKLFALVYIGWYELMRNKIKAVLHLTALPASATSHNSVYLFLESVPCNAHAFQG